MNNSEKNQAEIVIQGLESTSAKESKMGGQPGAKGGAATPESLKYISLVLLTAQNALLILVMRYVRTREGDMFLSSTAVIMSELFKFLACMGIILIQEGSVRKWLDLLHKDIVCEPMDCIKVSVPSLVYVLQNNLLYVAVSNLDAATFQVTYQLKILTTAIFSVVLLHKVLSRLQWTALFILFVGVATVQLQPSSSSSSSSKDVATDQNAFIGLAAVVASCFLSGFAGVYFEKILKGTRQSVWLRNIQLGFLGVVIGCVTAYLKDGDKLHAKGFFNGYDGIVWFVVCLQSFGGLLVAVVVKYADNILKGFATSAAIIVSCVASMYFFDFQLSLQFVAGGTLVMLAVYMYSKFIPAPTLPATRAM